MRWQPGELYALVHTEMHGEQMNSSELCSWNTSANDQTHPASPGTGAYHGQCQLWSMGLAAQDPSDCTLRLAAAPPCRLAA